MTSRTFGIAAFLAACFAASIAQSETRTLARYGVWEAFGGTANDGKPVCGVSSSGDGLFFSLKVFSGDNTVTVQLGSDKWKINKGDRVPVHLRFDNYPRWTANGTGMRFSDGDAGLWFTVARSQLRDFIVQFRASYRMVVQFGGSGMTDWRGDLTGTNAVTNVFANCVSRLD
jgi:hypothetical protein